MKKGDVVKFKVPTSRYEAAERFVVLELRGTFVLVEFICDARFRPTFSYLLSDMEIVSGAHVSTVVMIRADNH